MESRLFCEKPHELAAAALADEDAEDAVEAMDEILAGMDDTCHELDATDMTPSSREFDLCATCYGRFSADPLGRERVRQFQFSAN